MTNKERYEKYQKEYCSRCKNKYKDNCSIRIFQCKDIICTKCVYFTKED